MSQSSHPYYYEVTATIADEATAAAWARWICEEHIADVVQAGAIRGRLVQLDGKPHRYLVQYEFASRTAFEQYLRDHAPRLRAEGSSRFNAEEVTYERRTGLFLTP